MKTKNIILLTALILTILSSCHGLNPRLVNPPSEATLALRQKYWNKIVGEWSYEALSDTARNRYLYEFYRFEADGKMTGLVRYGSADSTEMTWQECVVSKDGEVCSPKQTAKFRYIINDTISGRWDLIAGGDDKPDALIIYINKSSADKGRHINPNSFTTADQVGTHRFSFCNGEQLFITNCRRKEATFKRGKAAPTF